ncbi:MAG: head-tail adaptor protein [Pseudomonadota bacterium]
MVKVFTRRLVREIAVPVPDGAGGYTESWEAQGAFWAEVKLRSGALPHKEFGRTARTQVRITTHDIPAGHHSRPVVGQRLRDGQRYYLVETVHESDRRHLVILASEITGEVTP